MQRRFREKVVYTKVEHEGYQHDNPTHKPIRLHRANLADRLLFEAALIRGFFRLVNQALIFWLMVAAALLSSEPSVKRGIYNNLVDSFKLSELKRCTFSVQGATLLPCRQ